VVVVALEAVSTSERRRGPDPSAASGSPPTSHKPVVNLSSTCFALSSTLFIFVFHNLGLLSCGTGADDWQHLNFNLMPPGPVSRNTTPTSICSWQRRLSPLRGHRSSPRHILARLAWHLRPPSSTIHMIASEGLMMQNHVHHHRNLSSGLSCQSGDHLDQPGRWAYTTFSPDSPHVEVRTFSSPSHRRICARIRSHNCQQPLLCDDTINAHAPTAGACKAMRCVYIRIK
jgi:hypothetical protein